MRPITGLAFLVAVVLTLSWAPIAALAQADPAVVFRQFLEAHNRGDVAASLSLFTDDAVFDVGAGFCTAAPCVGKEAIRRELERQLADQVRYGLLTAQSSGVSANFRVQITGLGIRQAGVDGVVGAGTAELRGDKIAAIRARLDAQDTKTATFLNFQRVAGTYRQYVEARNRGDVAAAVALWNEDGVLDAGAGLCTAQRPCAGRAAIGEELQRQRDINTHFTLTALQVSGDTLTFRAEIRNDTGRAAGVDRFIRSGTVEVRGDKITVERSRLDGTDPPTATLQRFVGLTGLLLRFVDAQNRGDAAAGLALLTDDATVAAASGPCAATPCAGPDAIARELERRFASGLEVTVASRELSGDTGTFRTELRSPDIRAAGFERVVNITTVDFRGNQIAATRSRNDLSDAQTAARVEAAQRAGAPAYLPAAGGPAVPGAAAAVGAFLAGLGLALRRFWFASHGAVRDGRRW